MKTLFLQIIGLVAFISKKKTITVTITWNPCLSLRNSGGVVVKLLACGARDVGSIPSLAATISEIVFLRFEVAIWL